jgi:hypothetical protein
MKDKKIIVVLPEKKVEPPKALPPKTRAEVYRSKEVKGCCKKKKAEKM